MEESKQVFEGGATSTATDIRLELIPKAAMEAMGRRFAYGAKRHGENNWRKGGRKFRMSRISHLLAHIYDYVENGGEANTDAIVCNAAMLCDLEKRIPMVTTVNKESE
jgi:hypothetical protein